MKKLFGLFIALALMVGGSAGLATAQTASVTPNSVVNTVPVTDHCGGGQKTATLTYVVDQSLNSYYWYEDQAVAVWNACPSWTGVELVEAATCPASADNCIYLNSFDPGTNSYCGFGEYYLTGQMGTGLGERGYASLNSECYFYTETQRATMTIHELGHALGIGYTTSKTTVMSDTVFPPVELPTYSDYQLVSERTK
jgi:hypothetical protein